MSPIEMQFIDNLSLSEKIILKSLLEQDREDIQNYLAYSIRELTNKESQIKDTKQQKTITAERLTYDIPMTYLPIMGIEYGYHFSTVSEYLTWNIFEKRKALHQHQIMPTDNAVTCLLNFLNEKIKEYPSQVVGKKGKTILEADLKAKIDIVLNYKERIYSYLKSEGEEYIFSGNPRGMYLDNLISERNFKNFERLVEILAMYSHLEDLEKENLESFQRFIRKRTNKI